MDQMTGVCLQNVDLVVTGVVFALTPQVSSSN
jgi:hypothetical protein